MATFQRVSYDDINSRQKKIFNFQKVSSLLADFGFATHRLTTTETAPTSMLFTLTVQLSSVSN